MPGFGKDENGGETPKQLGEQSDFYADQALEFWKGELTGQRSCSTEAAIAVGLLAIYCEIRRLADLMPTAEDLQEHTKALNLHARVMGDHIQGMKRYGGGR